MEKKKQKKESLTARVHAALCVRYRKLVALSKMRPSEAAMSAGDLFKARSLVRLGRKAKLNDDEILKLVEDVG